MKKLLAIIVLGLLLNTNAQAKHKTFDYPFLHWNTFEAKGSENHYKFQSNLRKDKDVLKEIKNTKKTGLISYLLFEDDKIVIDESDIPDKTRKGKSDKTIRNFLRTDKSYYYETNEALVVAYLNARSGLYPLPQGTNESSARTYVQGLYDDINNGVFHESDVVNAVRATY